MLDMTDSIVPRSDQVNAEDLLTGPRTVTIQDVRRGTVEQPIEVVLVEFPDRPFKPSKTVRRIMVGAWGPDASAYAGRRMTLYRDPTVRFGKDEVGGIRVSHMSHITKPLTLALTVTRGKRAAYVVQPLKDEQRPTRAPDPAQRSQDAISAYAGIGVTERQLTAHVGRKPSEWTPQDLASLEVVFTSIRRGETTVDEQFALGGQPSASLSMSAGSASPATTSDTATARASRRAAGSGATAGATAGTASDVGASGAPPSGTSQRPDAVVEDPPFDDAGWIGGGQ